MISKKYNIVYIILAVLAAIILWFYVVIVEDPDMELSFSNVNVVFTGENEILADKNLMIVEGKTSSVTLKIRAKRSTIMRLDEDKITITADVSDIESPGDYRRAYRITYPEGILSSSVTVLERYPSLVDIKIDRIEARNIDITGVIEGNISEGFLAEAFVFEPRTIKISGPVDEIDDISHALVSLNRTDIDKSITTFLPFTLIDNEGNTVDSEFITADISEIKTTLPILKLKELAINVDFLNGGGATGDNVSYKISPSTIMVSGPVEIIDGINMITVGVVDLSQVFGTAEYKYPILIPNGAQNLSGETNAEVSVEIKGLETRKIDAGNIFISNEPEEYEITPMTKAVPVMIRGPSETIDLVLAHNIRIVADMADINLSPGSHIVNAKVYVDGYSNIGAVGEYKVAISAERK